MQNISLILTLKMYSHATHNAMLRQTQGLEIYDNLRLHQPIPGGYDGIIPGESSRSVFLIF